MCTCLLRCGLCLQSSGAMWFFFCVCEIFNADPEEECCAASCLTAANISPYPCRHSACARCLQICHHVLSFVRCTLLCHPTAVFPMNFVSAHRLCRSCMASRQLRMKRAASNDLERLQNLAAQIRVNSRTVAAEIRRQTLQQRRRSAAISNPLTKRDKLVLSALLVRSDDPRTACTSFLLHRTRCCAESASDQPRAQRIDALVTTFMNDALRSAITFAGALETLPACHRRAWNTAGLHLAELGLATWTVDCNVCKRFAPTASQLQERWQQLRRNLAPRADPAGVGHTTSRSARRALQSWRRRWGFRYGKMRLRDHFSEGELLEKAHFVETFFVFLAICALIRGSFSGARFWTLFWCHPSMSPLMRGRNASVFWTINARHAFLFL